MRQDVLHGDCLELLEGRGFVLIEREAEYVEDVRRLCETQLGLGI